MPVQETIDLVSVINHMDAMMPFDITYVTADKKRGTGGEIIRQKGWVKCNLGEQPEPVLRRNKISWAEMANARNPQHVMHKTRNIMNPVTREIRKLHLRLIVEFNGKRVV